MLDATLFLKPVTPSALYKKGEKKTDLFFYSLSGGLLLETNNYVSVEWSENLRDGGDASLTFLQTDIAFDLVSENSGIIVEFGKRSGIVCGYRIENGLLSVNVKNLITLLERRVIPCDLLTKTGTPKSIVTELIESYAPYITTPQAQSGGEQKTVVLEKSKNLLEAIKTVLSGTGLGMKIDFDDGEFSFSFIEPNVLTERFSTENYNLSELSCSSRFTDVRNAAYYTDKFYPVENFDPVEQRGELSDNDPDNYMKQYFITAIGYIGSLKVYTNEYIYCDTTNGKFKKATAPQTDKVRYITLESEPALVFEQDLRELGRADAETLTELRSYVSEDWSAKPVGELSLGDVIQFEKTFGKEKGLKQMQVTGTKFSSDKMIEAAIFTPIEI